jgi:hypothetical protein
LVVTEGFWPSIYCYFLVVLVITPTYKKELNTIKKIYKLNKGSFGKILINVINNYKRFL